MAAEKTCANCDTPLRGPFCHQCGQRDTDMGVAIWRLLVDLLSETFEADGKLFKTLPLFLARPGELTRRYVDGQRARYTSPVRLLVFALAMGFLCLGFGAQRSLDRAADSLEDRPFVVEAGHVKITPEGGSEFGIEVEPGSVFEDKLHGLDGMNQRQAARLLLDAFLDAAPTVALALIPCLTLLLAVSHPYHLVIEHLVLSTLLHAQALLLLGAVAVTGLPWLDSVVVLWLHGQLLVSMKAVYDQSWRRTIAKWAAVVAVYWVLLVFAVLGVILLALWSL